MKQFALPALLLAFAAPVHAGIATSFDVTSAVHWTSNGGNQLPDSEAFTPFGGTFSSNLTPHLSCRNVYRKNAHISTCYFNADLSRFDSPYDSAYLGRLGLTEYNRQPLLVANLEVSKSGLYHSTFTFLTGSYLPTEDADASYLTGFSTNYQFHYMGTGMDWGATMGAAFADMLWHREAPGQLFFTTFWEKDRNDLLTGEETIMNSEGWDGEMKLRAVPEPTAPALFGIGLAAIAGLRRRKRS